MAASFVNFGIGMCLIHKDRNIDTDRTKRLCSNTSISFLASLILNHSVMMDFRHRAIHAF